MKHMLAVACLTALSGAGDAAAVTVPAEAQTTVRRAQQSVSTIFGRARLGVSVRDVEEDDVKTGKLSGATGAVVEEVAEESAAEKAGLRKGDVIIEFDGERVRSARQLTRLVQETPAGRKVPIVVSRDGQRVTLSAETREGGGMFESVRELEDLGRNLNFDLRTRPAPAPRARTTPPAVFRFDDMLGRNTGRLGITVDELSPQLAEYFGTKQGVLVTSVREGSVAAKAGLKAGDVITSVDGSSVDDPAELRRRLQGLGDTAELTISVMRDRKAHTLKGKLEPAARRRAYRSVI